MSKPTISLRPEPDHDAHTPTLQASLAAAVALVVCVVARIPHRVLDATGVRGWVLQLIVVVVVVIGVRATVRAPFASTARTNRARSRASAGSGLLALAGGVALTLPIYALLRATPAWWLVAWALFATGTVIGQVVMPFVLRAKSVPADPSLAERVTALGERAGVDLGRGASVVDKDRCNAYVVGLGATRRVVLERPLAEWPPKLVDQVVAHELGHWRLGHMARRLPLSVAAQLVTFAVAAVVLSWSPLLEWAGLSSAGDPRSYPLLLLLTPLLAGPARCAMAWYDRAQERAADRFALTLLADPDTFAAMLERAADEGGAPRRLPWWRLVIASHPPIEQRAAACTRFASTV